MASNDIFPVPASWQGRAWIDEATYRREYERSLRDPEGFWAEHAARLDWFRKPTKIRDVSYGPSDVHIRWFHDGTLNASVNCLDRHLAARGQRTAILWEGDDPAESRAVSYAELHAEVCRLANGLKSLGVRKGDRVSMYLPMVPEAAVAMLACARIGAIHSVVFAGFSPDVARRPDPGLRLHRSHHRRRRAARRTPRPAQDKRRRGTAALPDGDDLRRAAADRRRDRLGRRPRSLVPRPRQATSRRHAPPSRWAPRIRSSSSTPPGPPASRKACCKAPAATWSRSSLTHQYVLDYHDDDIFWCTADIGWVTGHSYIVYGPLANGATTVMFEGVPELSGRLALLADRRQAPGQHLLHRADGDPRTHPRRARRR